MKVRFYIPTELFYIKLMLEISIFLKKLLNIVFMMNCFIKNMLKILQIV